MLQNWQHLKAEFRAIERLNVNDGEEDKIPLELWNTALHSGVSELEELVPRLIGVLSVPRGRLESFLEGLDQLVHLILLNFVGLMLVNDIFGEVYLSDEV